MERESRICDACGDPIVDDPSKDPRRRRGVRRGGLWFHDDHTPTLTGDEIGDGGRVVDTDVLVIVDDPPPPDRVMGSEERDAKRAWFRLQVVGRGRGTLEGCEGD